jgi:hypothetical protein
VFEKREQHDRLRARKRVSSGFLALRSLGGAGRESNAFRTADKPDPRRVILQFLMDKANFIMVRQTGN